MSDKTNTTVRPLRAEDRPAWAALWRAYLDFYQSEVPDDVYDTTFARLLGKPYVNLKIP